MTAVQSERRFTRSHPCPVCSGWDGMPRSQGVRCSGFLSSDGRYCHCSRPEHAGGLPLEPDAQTFAHLIGGRCRCGVAHAQAVAPLRERPVRVLRDADFDRCRKPYPCDYNDEKGRRHAELVARAIIGAGVPDVRMPVLPGLGEHKDVADWLARRRGEGASDPELRAELERLVEQAPVWKVPSAKEQPAETQAARMKPPNLLIARLSTVEPRPLSWLWRHYVPRGMVSIVAGDGGLGKSTVALDLAARVSTGRPMPDGSEGLAEPAGVVGLS